jgi:hypothetical protein
MRNLCLSFVVAIFLATTVSAREPAPKKPMRVLLFAGGQTREYKFVRDLFLRELKEKRMELSILMQAADNQEANGAHILTEFPDRIGKDAPQKDGSSLSNYDVVIAFDADWTKLSKEQQKNLEKWVSDHKGSVFFIAGQVNTQQLAHTSKAEVDPIKKLLPVVLKDHRLVEIDSSRPYALKFGKKGDIKIGTKEEPANAGWNRFFWDDAKIKPDCDKQPTRGFYTCYPVDKLRAATEVLAAFAGPKELRINGGKDDPPYLARMAYGSGRTMYLGSGETWRLRQFNADYHERLWLQLVHSLVPAAPAK